MGRSGRVIGDYIFITLGAFLIAIGWSAFLIPAQIVGGGVGGIASLTFYVWKISPGIIYLGVNALLIIIAIRILGTSFGVRTVYGIICASLFLSLLPLVIAEPIIEDAFLATILGGAICGAGVGMAIAHQGSTGGTEIIALIVNHYRNISPGRVMLFLDVFIIASSYLVFHSLEKLVYGYVAMAVVNYTVDIYLEGSRQSVQFLIISKEKNAIAEKINNEVNRGITVLKGSGWYTKTDYDPLLVLARRSQLRQIMEIVKNADERAFVSVSKVMGVYGNGFDRMKY